VLVVQTLALTFDDGPDPDGTPLMLDVLARATHGRLSS
jgi:peptidoglycan/xylan/chitin deacetylase (PgdA/CDA1 family)